ncbi:MAG: hypothetical protein QW331_01900, partial [Candidatus Woesearchaeota archaeon]
MKNPHDEILDDALKHLDEDKKHHQAEEIHITKEDMEKSSKIFAYAVIGIAIIIITILISRYAIQSRPLTIDELHQKNIDGELSEKQGYVYKGYSFVFADGLWYTQLQFNNTLINLPLHFDPKSVENVPLTGAINSTKFNEREIYITFDPF